MPRDSAKGVLKTGSARLQRRSRIRICSRGKYRGGTVMKSSRCMLLLASLIASTLIAQDAQVTPLMSKDLADFPGKEGLMITVVYPPGSSDPIHRHNAHAFVYVLEGSIVMQVRGGKEMTLTPGQTFYEGPNDVHIIGRNASKTQPAKFGCMGRTNDVPRSEWFPFGCKRPPRPWPVQPSLVRERHEWVRLRPGSG